MVNTGAIAATSLVAGATDDDKWQFIHDGLSQFVGRKLTLNEDVCASALDANSRNGAIAQLLRSYDRVYCDPEQATDLYTRQSSLNVSAKDPRLDFWWRENAARQPRYPQERVNRFLRDFRRTWTSLWTPREMQAI